MTSNEFNNLMYHGKMEAILKGTYLMDRLSEHDYIKLYNLNNFYVEVFYDDHTHLITRFRAFEHTLFLVPYLENLKIAV